VNLIFHFIENLTLKKIVSVKIWGAKLQLFVFFGSRGIEVESEQIDYYSEQLSSRAQPLDVSSGH